MPSHPAEAVVSHIAASIAAFDHSGPTFDQLLDQVAAACATIAVAVQATRDKGLVPELLASALDLGLQQLATVQPRLGVLPNEAGIADYLAAKQRWAARLREDLN